MKHDLDRIDFALIDALQNDGRLSNKELANIAGLAPSTTHSRVRRLFRDTVIESVRAEVRPEVLGVRLRALVFVSMESQGPESVESAWHQWGEIPEVVGMFYVGGEDDIIVEVHARDTDHLREAVVDPIAASPLVRRVRTELIYRSARWPTPKLDAADTSA